MKKAVIVVGMHRSGTSAISGMLSTLGVFMGKKLFSAQKGVNEKGFYENAAIVDLNEKAFDLLNWTWDDPLANCFEKFDDTVVSSLEKQALELIKKEYQEQPIWGMKDPRTSLLLPFWIKVLAKSNIEPCFILMIRKPNEVVGSLKKRDDFSDSKSLLLWINYTLSSYWQVKNEKFVIVSFDHLIGAPTEIIQQLKTEFGLVIEHPEKQDFIDPKMQNQKQLDSGKSELHQLANSVYLELTSEQPDKATIEKLTKTFNELKLKDSSVFIEHIHSLKLSETKYRQLFYTAYKSIWWKIATPFRKLEKFITNN
jgi:hypothetical protein